LQILLKQFTKNPNVEILQPIKLIK